MDIDIDVPFSAELEDADLGSESHFRARIAEQPLAIPVLDLFRARNVSIPPEYKLFDGFELYLVPHRVSILKDSILHEVTEVGLRVTYDVGEMTCAIVSLIPEFQFVELATASFAASLSVNGELAPAKIGTQEYLPVQGGSLEVSGTAATSAALNLRGSLTTPLISAVGKGSRTAEWVLKYNGKPLYGRDIETWAIVVMPAGLDSLEYDIQLHFCHRVIFVPTRWDSQVQRLKCKILRRSSSDAQPH
jgi:hypothetical protein